MFNFILQLTNLKNLERGLIRRACDDLIETVATRIFEYNNTFIKNADNAFFYNFWQKATNEVAWDITTLNYDTCLENSLMNYEDGFDTTVKPMGIKGGSAKRFNPRKLADTQESRIMHIHGCIQYGPAIPSQNPNEYSFRESFYDMYKYSSYEDAKEHWFNRSNPQTQSGEQILIGPIITGLRKTDKVTIYPYSFYLYEFQKALLENQSLFIAGYSCNDIYLNDFLIRMAELHGVKRRIVIVTYFSEETKKNWHPDPYIRDTPTDNEYQVISRLLQEEYASVLAKLQLPKNGKLESKDKCVKIYFEGLKKAIEKYGDEIIEFLKG